MGKVAKYLTDSEVRGLDPAAKGYARSVFRNLRVWVEPEGKGGGKSFEVAYRFPPSPYMQYYRIGVYGKGHGQFTLKQAIQAQRDLYAWMDENPNRNPKERKKELKIEKIITNEEGHTFGELVEDYLNNCGKRQSTLKDDKRKFKQIFNYIPENTKLSRLRFTTKFEGRTGRERVMEVIEPWKKRGKTEHAKKLLGLLRVVFDWLIDKGWEGWKEEDNPARTIRSKWVSIGEKKTEGHKAITDWKELSELLEDISKNPKNADEVVISALKCIFLTGMRVGDLVLMKWDYVNEEDGVIYMPAEAMKGGEDFKVPITPPLMDELEKLKDLPSDYVFWSFRGRTTEYLNPSSINNALKNMDYGGKHTAQGTRKTMLTCGQDVLGFDGELIDRCLAHKQGNKVSQAYDDAELLEKRKEFLLAWGDALLANGLKI